ncbi:universal stress protein [Streptomyces sp. NPDC047141]|uniref:universal stress protein n=1 Tax=Streptomyces sp. NPDC047141 TaxID=3155738 RepID=UPI00340FD897
MTRPSPWGGGRIVVGVTGSLASLAALRHAASLARHAGAPLLAVLVWQPPEGEGLFARTPDRSWARLWGEDARRRLNEALLDGLGGVPDGLPAPAPVAEAGDGRGAGPSGAARRAF